MYRKEGEGSRQGVPGRVEAGCTKRKRKGQGVPEGRGEGRRVATCKDLYGILEGSEWL